MSTDLVPTEERSRETFPSTVFSDQKQDAILGHLLTHKSFFTQGCSKIAPAWFKNSYNGLIWEATIDLYQTFKRMPTTAEVRDCSKFLALELKERSRIIAQLNLALHHSTVFGLDGLRPDLTEWMKARLFKGSVENAAKLYNRAEGAPDGKGKRDLLQSAFDVMKVASKEIAETTFEEDNEESFINYTSDFEKMEVQYENALSFGIDILDKQLTPQAKHGSLIAGDVTVILAPVNIGKTSCMITVAVHNILCGKDVLLITHEGRPDDIKEKIWCCLLNINKKALYEMYRTAEGRRILDQAISVLKEHLTYIPMNKPALEVEAVAGVINKKQEEWVSKHYGKGYDLLVDDYPAKLTTFSHKKGSSSRRDKDEEVYNYFVQLGLESLKNSSNGFHVLSAIQTNREGSKVNKGNRGAERLLTREDVLESWGPMTSATNVITLNRDPLAEMQQRITYYIDKSRSDKTGVAVVCRTNYSHYTTHSNELGGTWYMGTGTMAEKIDSLLTRFKGTAIPVGEILTA